MRTFILILALLSASIAFGQDGPKPTQLREIPDGHVIIGGTDGPNDNGNTTAELDGDLVTATPPATYSGTTVQALIDEVAANIAASGDDWGSQVVVSNSSLSGNGTSGAPLAVNASVIGTASLNNDAGFITSPNDADANPTNEAQTLSKSGTTVTLTAVSGTGGGTFTDEVNDADASATNELQTITATAGTNNLVLSNGGGTVTRRPDYVEGCVTSTGTSFTLPSAPSTLVGARFTIELPLTVSTGTTAQLQVSGTTVTAGSGLYFAIESTDELCYSYLK